MSVIHIASGRREVRVEVEVTGTPEEVWKAIATGPGVSAWFVDTSFKSTGATPTLVRSDFGPGMESVARITSWDPPLRFTTESRDLGEEAPPVETTWTVTPRERGGCVVCVEHRLDTDRADWDAHLAAWESGWPAFFHLLQLTLEHFRGERNATCSFSATAGDADAAWKRLASGLGLEGVALGEPFDAPASSPPLSGRIERTVEAHERVLRLERPAPGLAHLFVMPMGKTSSVWLRFNYFGARAAEQLEHERPAWQAWMNDQFPASTSDSNS